MQLLAILALLYNSVDGKVEEKDCANVHLHYIANASNYQYVKFRYKPCQGCHHSNDYDVLSVEVLSTPVQFQDVTPYWSNHAKHVILEVNHPNQYNFVLHPNS